MEQPPIPRATSVLVLNDMINGNLRGANERHNQLIAESGLIASTARCVAALRQRDVPILWVRVERRADRKDVVDTLTDAFLAGGRQPRPAVTRGSHAAANVDELPVQPEDHVVLKPRYNPFIGTDLDLHLRSRGVTTMLLGGYSTNVGVESCARTARDLNYDVVVLSDCCFNVDRELHEWSLSRIMPLFARVMPSEQALRLLR
ncbi:MAG: cysteine hydrolase [Candidatus Rokubacteria bacterium]|nr:cysteine hydrolase [Candidatus Rokubacteria bacterium]